MAVAGSEVSDDTAPPPDGIVYSKRKNVHPFSAPALDSYAPTLGEERIERLRQPNLTTDRSQGDANSGAAELGRPLCRRQCREAQEVSRRLRDTSCFVRGVGPQLSNMAELATTTGASENPPSMGTCDWPR